MRAWLCSALLVMFAGSNCFAQGPGPANLEAVTYVDVVPANVAKFEIALAAHHHWLAGQGDPWRWQVWQVVAGPATGRYVLRSSNHSWRDFDVRSAMTRAADAHWNSTVGAQAGSVSSQIHLKRQDLTRAAQGGKPPALLATNRFLIKYDRFSEFASILPKLAQAMTQSNYIYFQWSQLLSGGSQYTLWMDFPKVGWEDNNPPPTPYWTMIENVHGAAEATRMRAIWFGSIAAHETWTELYRQDLSSPVEAARH